MFEIRRWEPMKELSRIESEFDDIIRNTLGTHRGGPFSRAWVPDVNCHTEGGSFIIEADLPGIDEKDLDVSIAGDLLTIKGERRSDWEEKEEGHTVRESFYGSFSRTLVLPEGADTGKVDATLKGGVLRLTMPVTAHMMPKKVTVKVEKEAKAHTKAA